MADISRLKMLVSRWVTGRTAVPAAECSVRNDWIPWETPGRQLLAEGRPQLAAGIRAGSYAYSVSFWLSWVNRRACL